MENLDVLIWREGTQWVACGVQRDLAAQGSTLEAVIGEFYRIVAGHVVCSREHGINPWDGLKSPAQIAVDFAASKIIIRTLRDHSFYRAVNYEVIQVPELEFRIREGF